MNKMDRRQKTALDEAYRYYRALENSQDQPEKFRLVHCLKTMHIALNTDINQQFKLTRQLWKRIFEALFDRLITNFSGYVLVVDAYGRQVKPYAKFPSKGKIEFHPDGCRRADDVFCLDIRNLYPATEHWLRKAWEAHGPAINPSDFGASCTEDGCFMKPVVFGHELAKSESAVGKQMAYRTWWELYWQSYCVKDQREKLKLSQQMSTLESIWGNLYY